MEPAHLRHVRCHGSARGRCGFAVIAAIASWRELRRALILSFGDRPARLRTLRILNDVEEHLGNYLLVVTMINVGVGIATGLICAVTGMPNPASLGALAAILNFIPIIGPTRCSWCWSRSDTCRTRP